MNAVSQPEPEHLLLLQQLKSSFSAVYMTLLSIIQGVALADLAIVVGASYQQFTLVHWLLVLAMFGLIVTVWNQMMIDAISMNWVPDFEDAALAFGSGAFELLLNHLIPLSLSLWLFALAGASCLEILVAVVVGRKAKQEAENRRLLRLLRRRLRGSIFHGTAGMVLSLLLGLLILIEGLPPADGLDGVRILLAISAVMLAIVWVASYFFNAIVYWRALLAYARTGHIPGDGKTHSQQQSSL